MVRLRNGSLFNVKAAITILGLIVANFIYLYILHEADASTFTDFTDRSFFQAIAIMTYCVMPGLNQPDRP